MLGRGGCSRHDSEAIVLRNEVDQNMKDEGVGVLLDYERGIFEDVTRFILAGGGHAG